MSNSQSNWKINRVQPGSPAVLPYIKGTETPNYYLVLGETDSFVYGFRPLAVAVPTVGSTPQDGVSTRVRVVPKDSFEYEAFQQALSILDFEKRDYGDGFVHFSTVSDAPATLVTKLEKLLSLSRCF